MIFDKVDNIQFFLNNSFFNKSIGIVPTMGALHQGHLSLISRAQKENDIVVVSIFVNPTQFNNANDLLKYPKNLKADLELLDKEKKVIIFAPSEDEIYPYSKKSENFNFAGLELEMEGKFRPGHFNGVATVVKRLFEIIKPTNAYFGEKDFQQLQIIKKMVTVLKLPINIVSCPIFREPNGLALSSRNKRLSKKQHKEAILIYKTLLKIKSEFNKTPLNKLKEMVSQTFTESKYLNLEYFIIADETTLKPIQKIVQSNSYRAFMAVLAGDVRLIDNIAL